MDSRVKSLSAFVTDLQARGRYTFTLKDIQNLKGRNGLSNKIALQRLKQQGRIVSPRRGFFVIVPVEYRSTGSPPITWFVDDLMRYLGQPYYVALLSAAAHHGAGHQQPMVFKVMTDRPIKPSKKGRMRIEFHGSGQIRKIPCVEVQTETGKMSISTPEATAFDLVRYAAVSGGIGHVATVLSELGEVIDAQRLGKLCSLYALPEVQRLGFILERIGRKNLSDVLGKWFSRQRKRETPLVVEKSRGRAKADSRWKVVPNEILDLDI
ncbi:MAG: type IV toxin-antitoxin system AbiEi family antitoxin [Pseudomonadota bacterium]